MEKLKRNTLEQDIVEFIERGGPTTTHKSVIERFNVSIEYYDKYCKNKNISNKNTLNTMYL